MNDKDKKAFDKWFIEKYRYNYNDLVIPESVKPQKEAWQASCEYKQKEIAEIEKLQAENAKLRECVEFYAYSGSDGSYARRALKELEEK